MANLLSLHLDHSVDTVFIRIILCVFHHWHFFFLSNYGLLFCSIPLLQSQQIYLMLFEIVRIAIIQILTDENQKDSSSCMQNLYKLTLLPQIDQILLQITFFPQFMQDTHHKINPTEIQFLRPLDQLMKVYCSTDKQYFCRLFQRKKELIDGLLSMGIDSEKYFILISKIFKSQSTQKDYARADLLSLRDKHKMNKEAWFQEIVSQTQISLTDQQNRYNEYQAQHKKPQQSVNEQKVPSIGLNLNFTQFTNFKLFDEFMQKYYQTAYRQTFVELYEKKMRIYQAVSSGKLKPELYFEMSQKAFVQTKNDDVRKALKTDLDMLEDLHDGNKTAWVKEAIKETKDQLPKQTEIYELHKKGAIVNKRQTKGDIDIDSMMYVAIPDVDPSDCISFDAIDRYMKQSTKNAQLYIGLYEKKQNLLKLVEGNKLNQKSYKEMLKRKMATVQNQTLKQIYQTELDDIQDVHEGNQKQWFQHILEETNISLMIQEDIYNNLKLSYKPVPQKKPQAKEQPKQEVTKPRAQVKEPQQTKPTKGDIGHSPLKFNPQKMFNLKVIEDAILQYQNNNKVFTKLFTQKQKIIAMMKNGQLDADKYKKLQQKMIKQFADIESVKDEVQFDLQAIEEFHEGDANKWFEETVERAGQYYDTQLQRYQDIAKNQQKEASPKEVSQQVKKSKELSKVEVKSETKIKQVQKQEKTPFNIGKMFSLKVLQHFLDQYAADQKLYIKFFSQKHKIIEMMQNGSLDAEKYKKFQQKMLEQFSDNDQIKDSISFQLQEINDSHDGDVNKWFQEVVQAAGYAYESQLERYQQLLEKYKKQGSTYQQVSQNKESHNSSYSQKTKPSVSTKKQFESKVSQAQSHINQSTLKSKIRFYLHQMAPYESLAKYFQKHHLNPSKNEMLKIYRTVPRQEIQQIIDKIKKDPDYDIVSYCKKFFPSITSSIFYQGAQNYDEKLKYGISACNKEVDSLKEYTKLLRKGLNFKNLEKVKERINQCQENIKYLNELSAILKKSDKWIPLPLIEQISVSYPNMDQFTHLDPQEIELKIVKIQGLDGEQIMKINFLGNKINELHVKNGTHNIVVKGKADSAENFMKILKGDLKCFTIQMYKTGWFSNTKLGQEGVETLFIRTNIHEGKVRVGNATIFYEARVRIAKNPMLTEIRQVKITKYPVYQHSKQVEQEFIAKYSSGKSK